MSDQFKEKLEAAALRVFDDAFRCPDVSLREAIPVIVEQAIAETLREVFGSPELAEVSKMLKLIEDADVGSINYDSPFDGEEVMSEYALRALTRFAELKKRMGAE